MGAYRKDLRLLAGFAALGLVTPRLVSAQEIGSERFSPVDVFKLKSVGDVRISPDGRTVAYEALDADIMIDGRRRSVRLIDVASGNDTLLADAASAPRWAPDSRSIVYADRDGGADRLMLATLGQKDARVVTKLEGTPSAVTWSRDGKNLAYTRFVEEPTVSRSATRLVKPQGASWAPAPRVISTVRYQEDGQGFVTPGHTQLFVVDMAGGVARQITSAPLDVVGDASWSPDGRSLIYVAVNRDRFGPGFRAGQIFRVPVAGGPPDALTTTDLSAQGPVVAPDGRSVAFVAFAVDGRDFTPIGLRMLDLRSKVVRQLDQRLDRNFSSVTWSADGKRLYAGYADRSIDKIRLLDADGSVSREVMAGLGGEFTVSDEGVIAFPVSRSHRPLEVAIAPAGSSEPRLLTRRNEALLASKVIGDTVRVATHSSLDDAVVEGWLTRPPGYVEGRRYPLILAIHGGPYGYDGPSWRTSDQLYAASGYAVLHVNYRGSTSYGFAFADRIAKDPLLPSYADLMSAVDAAVASGVADPERLYVTGGSAGGELTAWIVGHTNRFKAAMAEKPVINRTAKALTSDQYTSATLIDKPMPWDDAPRQWSLSALSAVGNVATPTMLVVGEEDRRTPPGEAVQFYNALKLRGVETALVLFPRASHASLGGPPSQLISMSALTIDWFARHQPSR